MNAVAQDQSLATIDSDPRVVAGFTSVAGFELLQRAAKMLAASTLVPDVYQNNLSNCAIALNMAQRMGADPLMICQNLYMVHGKPGWSSQFLIAGFNSCGKYSAIRYEWSGIQGNDDWGCRAYAIEKDTGERLTGSIVTIKMAKDEKWFDKTGSKWKTMPQQMLMYRAAAFFIRVYAPEQTMGLHTADELGDVYDADKDGGGTYVVASPGSAAALLNDGLMAGKKQPAPAVQPTTGGEQPVVGDIKKPTEESLSAKVSAANSLDELDIASLQAMDWLKGKAKDKVLGMIAARRKELTAAEQDISIT